MKILRRGFSLIEMLIYMGLLAMFLVVLSGMFVSILNVQLESQASAGVQQDGQYLLLRMAYDLQRVYSFTVSSPSVLTTPAFTYALVGDNLTDGTDNLNGAETKISNLNFTRVGNGPGFKDTVQVSFVLESLTKRQSGPEIRNFSTTVGLR